MRPTSSPSTFGLFAATPAIPARIAQARAQIRRDQGRPVTWDPRIGPDPVTGRLIPQPDPSGRAFGNGARESREYLGLLRRQNDLLEQNQQILLQIYAAVSNDPGEADPAEPEPEPSTDPEPEAQPEVPVPDAAEEPIPF